MEMTEARLAHKYRELCGLPTLDSICGNRKRKFHRIL